MIGRSDAGERAPEALLADLLAEQTERFAALDRGLPRAVRPPAGDLVVAPESAGRAAGVITHHRWPAGSAPLLWSAAEVSELHPVLGVSGQPAVHALLAAWRSRLGSRARQASDSSAVVTWPSRDVVASRAFLDHGLIPLAVLAVRPPGPPPALTGVDEALTVRPAAEADLEHCVALAMHEISYSSLVGGSVPRPEAESIKRTALRERWGRGEPIWVAELDGRPVGLLECGLTDATPGSWLAGLLPAGRWGYVNCASVVPGLRGRGVGHAMVRAALPVLEAPGSRGTYLYYNPPNPLSSVFWPRHGYRPLWTLWEVRPASALR